MFLSDEEEAIINLTRELSQAKIQRLQQRANHEQAIGALQSFRVSFAMIFSFTFFNYICYYYRCIKEAGLMVL